MMRRGTRGRKVWSPIFLVALSMLFPTNAHAYIDPGSGLLVLQSLIAGSIGALFVARRFIVAGLRRVLGGRRAAAVEPPAGEGESGH